MTDIDAIMAAAATRLVIKLRMNAARRYQANPALLDMIVPGLSIAHPTLMLKRIDTLGAEPSRFTIAPVRPINIAGARLYARWLRRFEGREAVAQDIKERTAA